MAHQPLRPLQVLPTSNVARFFKQQAAVATHSHWQLLQLAPTSTPGLFRMWVLVESSLYCVPLRVPRQVVVNCSRRCEQQQAGLGALLGQMQACRALLPPGDTPRYVYEVSADERREEKSLLTCSAGSIRCSASCAFGLLGLAHSNHHIGCCTCRS
jgi:hypothetical protein